MFREADSSALCPDLSTKRLFDQALETFGYFTKESNVARDEPFGIECDTIVGATQRQPAKKNEIGGIASADAADWSG
jgi:hypothetical protein